VPAGALETGESPRIGRHLVWRASRAAGLLRRHSRSENGVASLAYASQ
jgi:hypothetical protein